MTDKQLAQSLEKYSKLNSIDKDLSDAIKEAAQRLSYYSDVSIKNHIEAKQEAVRFISDKRNKIIDKYRALILSDREKADVLKCQYDDLTAILNILMFKHVSKGE